MNATSGSSTTISRARYLDVLRRAFLLRVHPDRFRSSPRQVRQNQATLVKALADRLSQPDFAAWQQHQQQHWYQHGPGAINSSNGAAGTYRYVMERRDGSIIKTSLRLAPDVSVDAILTSMVDALKQCGGATMIPPPPLPAAASTTPMENADHVSTDGDTKTTTAYNQNNGMHFAARYAGDPTMVDHTYDVNSRRGRDLFDFLANIDDAEVERRKARRMDAVAAASTVRRLYQFQAVDATTLGWSSASVAILLRQLAATYEEHAIDKFHVQSFYPLTAVFTYGDLYGLDIYSGVLRFHPALTPMQWLETLQLVTQDQLDQVHYYRRVMAEKRIAAQAVLGVKLQKGLSCSGKEYYAFLDRFSSMRRDTNPTASTEHDSNSLMLEPCVAIIESSQACRRPKVTKAGCLQLGADMDTAAVYDAIARLSSKGRERLSEEQHHKEQCRQAITQLQWSLGIQKVFRTTTGLGVTHSQFLSCISRIMRLLTPHDGSVSQANIHVNEQQNKMEELKIRFAGKALGIAGTGNFCHLSDDGSMVIPHDWR